MRKVGLIGMCLFGILVAIGCGVPPSMSTDAKMAHQQEAASAEAARQVGQPGVTRFTEKRLVKQLYEKRDQEGLVTHTYIVDMSGRLFKVCDSVGYGIPYGVQFSNPERVVLSSETPYQGNLTLPQSEPNGLYMPPGAEGTWVQCVGPQGHVEPVYIEPRVLVSPFELRAATSYME